MSNAMPVSEEPISVKISENWIMGSMWYQELQEECSVNFLKYLTSQITFSKSIFHFTTYNDISSPTFSTTGLDLS